jgi:hypothetical protein
VAVVAAAVVVIAVDAAAVVAAVVVIVAVAAIAATAGNLFAPFLRSCFFSATGLRLVAQSLLAVRSSTYEGPIWFLLASALSPGLFLRSSVNLAAQYSQAQIIFLAYRFF